MIPSCGAKSVTCIFSCTAPNLWWWCDAAKSVWHWAAGWPRGTEGSQMAHEPSLRGQQASQAREAGSVTEKGDPLVRNTSLWHICTEKKLHKAQFGWAQCKGITSKKALSKKPSFLSFQLGPRLWAPSHSLIMEVGIKHAASPGLHWQRNSSVGSMKLTHLNAGPEPHGGKPHQKEMKVQFVHAHTHTHERLAACLCYLSEQQAATSIWITPRFSPTGEVFRYLAFWVGFWNLPFWSLSNGDCEILPGEPLAQS